MIKYFVIHKNLEIDMNKSKIVDLPFIIFYVKNVSDLLTFYQKAFDIHPSYIHESGHFAELFSGAVTLAFRSEEMAENSLSQSFQKNRLDSPLQAYEISLHTHNVDDVYKKALIAGAHNIQSPHMKPWGQKAANVRDPAGILIEITEYPKT